MMRWPWVDRRGYQPQHPRQAGFAQILALCLLDQARWPIVLGRKRDRPYVCRAWLVDQLTGT
jgi:hypothetical protein